MGGVLVRVEQRQDSERLGADGSVRIGRVAGSQLAQHCGDGLAGGTAGDAHHGAAHQWVAVAQQVQQPCHLGGDSGAPLHLVVVRRLRAGAPAPGQSREHGFPFVEGVHGCVSEEGDSRYGGR